MNTVDNTINQLKAIIEELAVTSQDCFDWRINQRSFLPCGDSVIIIDDSGGENITSYSEAEAVALFLNWFRAECKVQQAQLEAILTENKRKRAAIEARKKFQLVVDNDCRDSKE